MESHLLFSKHMTPSRSDRQVVETYLGQAHFAGTGPDGRTCRECVFYYPLGFNTDGDLSERREFRYRSRHEIDHPSELHDARCNRPILNKAERCFPHYARACKLFEPSDSPPLAKKLPKPRKPKAAGKRRAKA